MLLGGLAPAALGGLAFDKLAGEKLIKLSARADYGFVAQ
jgi:hypothetical protein